MRSGLIIAPLLILAGCNAAGGQERDDGGSHRFEKRDLAVAGSFDRVSLSGSPNVIVAVGGAPRLRAEGDSALLDRLELTVQDGSLHIGYKRDDSWSWGFRGERKPVTIYVSMPSISGASIGGSGDIRVDRAEGRSFSGSIGGSGSLELGAMKVANAAFSIAGSGDIRAAGTADSAALSVAGSGDIDAAGLQTRTTKVSVLGSGDVRARASESADVSIMGSGDVELAGGAKCKVHKMGSGDVRCGA